MTANSGLLFTVCTIALLNILNSKAPIDLVNPFAYLIIPVIYTVMSRGFKYGLASAFLSIAYSLYFFSSHGRLLASNHENLIRVFSFSFAFLIAVIITSFLKQKNEKILQQKNLEEFEILQKNKYYSLFLEAPVCMWILTGPRLIFDFVNEHGKNLLGNKEIKGVSLYDISPISVFKIELLKNVEEVFKTGESITVDELPVSLDFENNALVTEKYFNLISKPLKNYEGVIEGVKVFCIEVTGQVQTRQKIEHASKSSRVLADAIPHLVWVTDPGGLIEYCNMHWFKYTGLSEPESLGISGFNVIYEEDKENVISLWEKSKITVEPFECELRITAKDGSDKWFLCRAVPHSLNLENKLEKWFITATDIHEKKQQEILLEQSAKSHVELTKKLESSKKELETILTNVGDGISAIDNNGKIIFANKAAAKLSGFSTLEEFMNFPLEDISKMYEIFNETGGLFEPELLPSRLALNGLVAPEQVIQFKFKGQNETRWSLLSSTPILNDAGGVAMALNVFKDITQLKLREAEIQSSIDRQTFMVKASELLSSSLDYEVTLKSICHLAVPKISDWVAIDMLEPDGSIKRLSVAHKDKDKIEIAYEMEKKYPTDPNSKIGLPNVLRTMQSEFYPNISDEMLVNAAHDSDHLELMRKIGMSSVIMVPIVILGKIAGAITFVTADSHVAFTTEDLDFAEELAHRASLAVQNSRMFLFAQETIKKERQQTVLIDTILSNAPMGFAFVNNNLEYLMVNKQLAEMNGFESHEHLGKKISGIASSESLLIEQMCLQVLETGKVISNIEITAPLRSDPKVLRHWYSSYYPISDKEGKILGVGIMINEVTEKIANEKEIHFRANYDPLTELPNRKFFEEKLQFFLKKSKTENLKFAVIFTDLDRLKNINDTLGHDVGDSVLKEIATRLKAVLREEDIISRWGGDEFVILINGIENSTDGSKVANKILKAIEPPMRLKNQTLYLTGSVGIAIFPNDGLDGYSLQKNADTALYRAKESGRNRYEMYNSAMNFKAEENLTLENDLRKAIEQNEFVLHYQPILDLKRDKILSVESLVRWQHPTLGLLPPSKFLKISEEIGLIIPLGNWVLRQACLEIGKLRKMGFPLRVSVNVSARQFAGECMVNDIKNILKETDTEPSCLEIEVTESIAMENLDTTQHTLKELKDLGIIITVDDFGIGYSSLNYLKRFPFHQLKIDKTFVRHVITDEQDTSIIKAIISMANSLHLRVVAEGVDTPTQLSLLKSLGCDFAQGFYISKPLCIKDLIVFIEKKNTQI